jgi:alpha-methylacyl-CoA racemase
MTAHRTVGGPLAGVRALEVGGIGPAPFCGMLLADMGVDVIRIERPDSALTDEDAMVDVTNRGRRSVCLDLKKAEGRATLLRLIEISDLMYEGSRPGVAERLGIGPQECLQRNPSLVYGRITGWGQSGPMAMRAGHDINYIGISGALYPCGPADGPPVPPLHHLGDYGGGGTMLALGLVAALTHARATGVGQVVDTAILDGTALMTAYLQGERTAGRWSDVRGENLLDGGAPFYRCYECADGQYVAVGAIEPKFSAQLQDLLGLGASDELRELWYRREAWPHVSQKVAKIIATRTRDEWVERSRDYDACLTPVLSPAEVTTHPHNADRGVFVPAAAGGVQPAPSPRFDRTPSQLGTPPMLGEHTDEVLAEVGLTLPEIAELRARGVVGR